MDIRVSRAAQGLIIAVDDARIDAAVAIEFKEAIRRATEESGTPVIRDLSKVTFLDRSGLGAIVAVMKLLAPDRRLELAGLTPSVAKVFRLTRMDTVFTIHPHPPGTLQDAV